MSKNGPNNHVSTGAALPSIVFDEAAWAARLQDGDDPFLWTRSEEAFTIAKKHKGTGLFRHVPDDGDAVRLALEVQEEGRYCAFLIFDTRAGDKLVADFMAWGARNGLAVSEHMMSRLRISIPQAAPEEQVRDIKAALGKLAEFIAPYCEETPSRVIIPVPERRSRPERRDEPEERPEESAREDRDPVPERVRRTLDQAPEAGQNAPARKPVGKLASVVLPPKTAQEVREIVSIFKHEAHFRKFGARFPAGVILHGSQGVGKTMLANAIADETGMKLHKIASSDFRTKWYGESSKQLRASLDGVKGPALVFIDEIDTVVGRRDELGNGSYGPAEDKRILGVLLDFLDSAAKKKILVIAATNRPADLDPALTRPGRFDRLIEIGLPDDVGREKLFHLTIDRLSGQATAKCWNKEILAFAELVKKTRGFSPAGIVAAMERALHRFALQDIERPGEMEFIRQEMLLETIEEIREEMSVNPDKKF